MPQILKTFSKKDFFPKGLFLKFCGFFFFSMWTIFLKVFIEFVTILLLFYMFWFYLAVRQVGSQLPSQELNLHPLRQKVKSQLLDSQGSPHLRVYFLTKLYMSLKS